MTTWNSSPYTSEQARSFSSAWLGRLSFADFYRERIAISKALATTVSLRTKFPSPIVRVSPDLILEDQSDCPLGSIEAYLGKADRKQEEEMNELTNKSWAPLPPGIRQRHSLQCSSSLTQSSASGRRRASLNSSTARKEVHRKFFKTWFWVGALLIVVAFGLALWPVRRLYLTLKEKFDERWEENVL
jgi:hypothetical protein